MEKFTREENRLKQPGFRPCCFSKKVGIPVEKKKKKKKGALKSEAKTFF